MPSLGETLDTIRRGAEGDGVKPGRIPADALAVMHRVTAEQRASGYQQRMPQPGTAMPAFALPNQDGVLISSRDLLADGPLVISFFRGRW